MTKRMELCPCCSGKVPAALGPIVMDPSDGLPVALSITEGLGLPVADVASATGLLVLLNKEDAGGVVAFDRKNGLIWRHQKDNSGNYMVRDGQVMIEKVKGDVEVRVRG